MSKSHEKVISINAAAISKGKAIATDISTLVAAGLGPVRQESFAERVYESLFHAIVEGKIPVSSRLPSENELAILFDVSRPTVRQAIDRLREDRMVNSVRGSGTYVNATPARADTAPDIGPADRIGHIMNGLELRLAIEPQCAYLAALRRSSADLDVMDALLSKLEEVVIAGGIAHHFDFAFHEAIAMATANQRFVQVLKTLEYDVSHAVNLMRHMVHLAPWTRSQDAMEEHRNIFKLIKQQDAEGASRAMRGHIENARSRAFNSRPGL
jgi:GntR family transcriptional repressor for pyruvate dehydrogenase complex